MLLVLLNWCQFNAVCIVSRPIKQSKTLNTNDDFIWVGRVNNIKEFNRAALDSMNLSFLFWIFLLPSKHVFTAKIKPNFVVVVRGWLPLNEQDAQWSWNLARWKKFSHDWKISLKRATKLYSVCSALITILLFFGRFMFI